VEHPIPGASAPLSTQTVQILRATETKQETLDGEILEQLIERSVRLAREIE
jgi:hypothetical protein